jgi:predicted ATP-dependent endonuclease of OLD family
LADAGTQVIYTTHSQDFVDLAKIDCVQLVSKTVADGTKARPPKDAPLNASQHKRLVQVRQFSAPRNEVFFADSVVLVEGPTDQATIGLLAPMMPTSLDCDRLNCSIIEVGGKQNLPQFIRMMHALGKRVLAVYDTDSHHTAAKDVATDMDREKRIAEALGDGGKCFKCDPYLEALAGVPGNTKRDKEAGMREHVATWGDWNGVPGEVGDMMAAVAAFARADDSFASA